MVSWWLGETWVVPAVVLVRGALVGTGVVLLLGLGGVVGYWGCDRSIICGAVRFFAPT